MSPAKKVAAKKAPAKRAPNRAPNRAPVQKFKPSRFAAFDSASDEWAGEPVAFLLDGKEWDCFGAPSSKVVKWLRDPGDTSTTEFLLACVVDREGFSAHLEEHPVPQPLLSGIVNFLMKVYLGIDPGK